MKTMMLLSAVLGISCLGTRAQEAKGAQTMVEYQSARPAKEEKKPVVTVPKQKQTILGQPVVYGGFLTDLARAEKKRAMLSLRNPVDPQKDLENVSFYPGTDKVQGVVLFSIKF